VFQSQDVAPFKSVRQGFRNSLAALRVRARIKLYTIGRRGSIPAAVADEQSTTAPDLVFAIGPKAARAAIERFDTTPIVAVLVRDPAQLEGAPNATGVLFDYTVETQLQWMRKLLPNRTQVGVLFSKKNDKRIRAADKVAKDLGLDLLPQQVHRPRDLPLALRELARDADLIWAPSDRTVINENTAKQFIVFSFQNRIPLSGDSTGLVKAGALFSLERDYADIGKQAGELAAQILGGAAPATLPPEPPRRLLYSVNLKTARHMRIQLSDEVVQNAARAFE
jgi:putative ABC transport system substrate-binding protein